MNVLRVAIVGFVGTQVFAVFNLFKLGPGLSLADIGWASALFLVLITIIQRGKVSRSIALLGLAVLGVLLVSMGIGFVAEEPTVHWRLWRQFVAAVSSAWAIAFLVSVDQRLLTDICAAIVIVAVVGVITAMLESTGVLKLDTSSIVVGPGEEVLGPDRFGMGLRRSTGILGTMGRFGTWVWSAGFIALSYGVSAQNSTRRILPVAAGIILIGTGLVTSQSRSGFVAVALTCVAFSGSVVRLKGGSWKTVSLAVGSAVVVTVLTVVTIELTTLADRSYQLRMIGNTLAIDAILESPLTGDGFGAVRGVLGYNRNVHNGILSMAAGIGVPLSALIVMLWLLPAGGVMWIRSHRLSWEVVGLVCVVVAAFVELMFYGGFTDFPVYIGSGALFGSLVSRDVRTSWYNRSVDDG